MPAYLYNTQVTTEVYADNEYEADLIIQGLGGEDCNKIIQDVDVMLVESDNDDTKRTCCRPCCDEIRDEVGFMKNSEGLTF